MIQSNYFTSNPDLLENFHELLPWDEIISIYENDFSDAQEFQTTQNPFLEMAPNNKEEALSFYEEVLRSCGEVSGKEVSQVAAKIDKEGLLFSNGKVTHPGSMVDMIKKYRESGLTAVNFKRKFGGLGVPNVVKSFVSELMYRSDSSVTIAVGSLGLASILETYASEEMQKEWIPKLIHENYVATMGLSEPDYGSDLPSVATRAIQKEGEWYLTGTKRYQTMACGVNGEPAVTLVLARTGSLESNARGLSFFLVENKDYQIQGIEKKLGIKASATCETVFDQSKGHLIGKEGEGLVKYVMGMLNGARLSVASQGVGIATAAWEEAKKYAEERIQFGKPIQEIPAVKRMLNRMEREVSAMRALMLEASLSVDRYHWQKERDKGNGTKKKEALSTEKEMSNEFGPKFWEKVANTLTPIAKYYNSETCNSLVYDALQVLGGAGFTEDYDLSRLYRDARITTIYDGTTQIQINAAIGGVSSGMSETGVFRKYLNLLKEEIGADALGLPTSLESTWDEFEKLLSIYKAAPEVRDAYSFDIVSSCTRLVLSLLMERSYRKSKNRKEIRKELCREFHLDSLSIVTGNRVRLENAL